MYMYIYIYICVCICLYLHLSIYLFIDIYLSIYFILLHLSLPPSLTLSLPSCLQPKHFLHCITGGRRRVPHLSLYKILFRFKALLWESIIRVPPPPHLQSLPYCNTIARLLGNRRPLTDPPFVCHTPYSIGNGNIL